MSNKNLSAAKNAKNDEFYTQYADIQKEINAYLDYDPDVFRGKTVLLPCDDPEWSNFTRFFAQNFEMLGLKKLISTSYAPDAKMEKYGILFEYAAEQNGGRPQNERGKIFVLDHDTNASGRIDFDDLEWDYLDGDGDFRSEEVCKLRAEADVIVTTPPFSLFLDYVGQLIRYDKKFLIIGPQNAIHYKDTFELIMANKMWLGYGFAAGNAYFSIPKGNVRQFADGVYDAEKGLVKFRNCTWFTNLDHKKRHEEYVFIRKYNRDDYQRYANFDAIDVKKVSDIPEDWNGLMGVPDTFLEKYNPDQFEIVGLGSGDLAKQIGVKKNFRGRTDVALKIGGKDKCPYSRIIIRRKPQ